MIAEIGILIDIAEPFNFAQSVLAMLATGRVMEDAFVTFSDVGEDEA